jgi:hypothetical protein
MEIRKISNDLQENLEQLASVAADSTLSSAEKNSRLSVLKQSALASIDVESTQQIGFVAQGWLSSLKASIKDSDHFDFPTPERIDNQIAVLNKLADTLNSLSNYIAPDLSELNRLLTKLQLGRLNKATGQKINAFQKEQDEAAEEFKKRGESIESQKKSAQISAGVGIAVACVQVLAAGVSLGVNSSAVAKSKATKEAQKEFGSLEDTLNDLKNAKDALKSTSADLHVDIKSKSKEISAFGRNGNSGSAEKASNDFKALEALNKKKIYNNKNIAETNNKISEVNKNLKKKDFEIQQSISDVQWTTQKMSISNEMIQILGKAVESSAKVGTANIDLEAGVAQIDSDKARFRKEQAEKIEAQYDKELSDINDAVSHSNNSCANMLQAMSDSMQRIIS